MEITIDEPAADAVETSSFSIRGKARTFENMVYARIKDENGLTLWEESAVSDAPDVGQFGNYIFQVDEIKTKPRGKLIIEVFEKSAKDGGEINKITREIITKG